MGFDDEAPSEAEYNRRSPPSKTDAQPLSMLETPHIPLIGIMTRQRETFPAASLVHLSSVSAKGPNVLRLPGQRRRGR